jgi:hypothetical protein
MLEHLSFPEMYIHGRIGIVVPLNTTISRDVIVDSGNPGFIYLRLQKRTCEALTIWVCDLNFSKLHEGYNWGKLNMLIQNAQSVQAIEKTPFTAFESFNTEKEFLRITSGCFYSFTHSFITGLRPSERKGCISVLCTAIEPYQFPHSMIERGSEIMDAISNHQGEICNFRIANVIMEELSARISIFAYDKSCIIALSKPIESSLDILEVRIGPFDLQEGTFEHRGSHHEEETEDQEGCGDSHSEAGRLLQESEESRHPITGQRTQEVTAETAPSHRRGGYTATHTRLGNPEDAS